MSSIRNKYGKASQLSVEEKNEKVRCENDEKKRLEEQRIDLAEKSFGSCPTPIN
jgi:hypothetical protein